MKHSYTLVYYELDIFVSTVHLERAHVLEQTCVINIECINIYITYVVVAMFGGVGCTDNLQYWMSTMLQGELMTPLIEYIGLINKLHENLAHRMISLWVIHNNGFM